MFTLRRHIDIPAPVEEVFAFHLDPRNLLRVSPPFIPAKLVSFPERLELGAHIDLRARLGPMWFHWLFEVTELCPNERFTISGIRGPFRFWEHVHDFEPTDAGTRLTDTVRYELPGGVLGRVAAPIAFHRYVRRTLEYRQRRTLALVAEAGR